MFIIYVVKEIRICPSASWDGIVYMGANSVNWRLMSVWLKEFRQ